jgi:hypothetical protein
MKSLAMLAAAALLVGLATFGVACSNGSSALTLEEYFQKLDKIQNDTDATFATQEASTGEPAEDASGEELASFLRDSATSSVDILRAAAADVDDLEPPDEVADAHGDIVAAINGLVAALDGVADSIPDTLTSAEADALFNSDELDAVDEQFVAACTALEALAADNNITVDLACDE